MGSTTPTFWSRLRDAIPIVFLSAAFSVGVFASTTKYRTDQLEDKITTLQASVAYRVDLDSAIQIRNLKLDGIDRRVQVLEQLARETSDTLKALEKGQAVIVANSLNQKASTERVEKKLDDLIERPQRQ